MGKKHIAELLIEADKRISRLIDNLEKNDVQNQMIIDEVNETIRQLDKIVESLESQA